MSQALLVVGKHELTGYRHWGESNVAAVRSVLETRFKHKNADGTLYVPRIASSLVYAPWYHVITLEAQALWHFSKDELLHDRVLDAIAGTVKRPCRYIARVPGQGGRPDQEGIAYVITLHDIPAEAEAELPVVYALDWETRPSDELRVCIGTGRRGPAWPSVHDIGHALVCGMTKSGKSTLLHSAIVAMSRYTPEQIQLVLVDPKRSEFPMWRGLPHLLRPIATTEDEAADVLGDLARLVDERGDVLAGELCRDIGAYNRMAERPIPVVVCMIDECLDLVNLAGARSELARSLKTLAVRGRSAGVYVWAATQHASAVDGLPRVVNVNLMSRFVFHVADGAAARSAGCPGAEAIPAMRRGRMLVKLDDGVREMYQAPFIAEDALLSIAAQFGSGVSPVGGKRSELDDEARVLVEWALNRGGYLSVADIQRQTGRSKRQAEDLASQWERSGWLAKDKSAGNKRKATEVLIQLFDT